jgi:hypothetical protein
VDGVTQESTQCRQDKGVYEDPRQHARVQSAYVWPKWSISVHMYRCALVQVCTCTLMILIRSMMVKTIDDGSHSTTERRWSVSSRVAL